MSSKTKRLNDLIDEQQAILSSIRAEATRLDEDRLAKENEELTLELKNASSENDFLKQENESLKKELDKTKSALFSKIAQEKLFVFEKKQREISNIYYRDELQLTNRLDEYSLNCQVSINETIRIIEDYATSEFDDILERLKSLKTEAEEKKKSINEYCAREIKSTSDNNFAAGEELKNEPLTEYEKRTAAKQKSLEAFIGLNVLSKAGILLFIVGIIMLGRFAYVHMSDTLKGVLIYILAAALVGVGELFHKKENTIFSTTLISGGVATLYAACTTSYFAFHIYGVRLTFILCIVITAIAILLSDQIKSQIVCGFAAVGGYLPVVALYMIGFGKAAADITFLPVSSVYFCVLAVVIFIMTYNKKWQIAQFIGYGLHLVAVGGVAKCAYSLRGMSGYGFALPLATAFAVASFVIYLLMPATKIIRGKKFSAADSILLILNTISGAVSVSLTINNCISNEQIADRVIGVVFLVFSAIYAVLMVFSIKDKKNKSSLSTIITSISALVFSMFVVPFVFDMEYAAIGWAAEGAILALISIEKRLKIPEFAGLFCMLLSVPFAIGYAYDDEITTLSLVTISVVLSTFWLYTVRGLIEVKLGKAGFSKFIYYICEILTAFSSAGYLYYIYTCILKGPFVFAYSEFTNIAVMIIALMLAVIVIQLGIFKNAPSVTIGSIASICLFAVVLFGDIKYSYSEITNIFSASITSKPLMLVNIVLLVIINIAMVLMLAGAVFNIINFFSAPAWIFTMSISASIMALVTAVVMSQFDIKFSSVILSALYIAIACVLLFIGFRKNYTVVRSSGLVLILIAFAKLCFVDTSALDSGWKIASYFAFGALLIVISFIYQRFTKKIENDDV